MRFVSRAEREQLNAARDPKARVRATIELAADHLTHAEYYTSGKKFVQASEELGGYLGLIDNAVGFIGDQARDKGSTRDLYRHLDIALRAQIPRIAVMRRSTPAEYAVNLKAVEEYARDTRADVLESFYGHTVLRGDPEYQKKPDKTKNLPEEYLFAKSAATQTRDHLTEQEGELVRFNQELDKRTDVFIRAINLRFAIINGTAAPPKPKKTNKEEPDWGDPPKGTRAELLGDIAGILDEAITNIDDVSRRDEKNPLLSRSLRKLTAATNGYLNQLNTLRTQARDADELSAIVRIEDDANQITAVGNKLPAEAPDSDKKKKKP